MDIIYIYIAVISMIIYNYYNTCVPAVSVFYLCETVLVVRKIDMCAVLNNFYALE